MSPPLEDRETWPVKPSILALPAGPRYALALGMTATAFVVTVMLGHLWDRHYFVVLAAIAIAGLAFGKGPGLVAAVVSVLGFNVLILPPYAKLSIRPTDLASTIAFATVAVLLAWVSGAARSARLRSEAAEMRARFLAEVSLLASASLGREDSLTEVARATVPRVADWCVVHVLEGPGIPDRVIVEHRVPELAQRAMTVLRQLEGPLDVAPFMRQTLDAGEPRLLPALDSTPFELPDPEVTATLRSFGLRSAILLPLRARGRALGVVVLATAESGRRFAAADLDLARELGSRLALGIENARLYREAQDAIRARDEFLSMATHDLRSPLASILIHVQCILRDSGAAAVRLDDIHARAGKVERLLSKLTTLMDVLLDTSRIASGKLVLDRAETDLVAVVREVQQRLEPLLASAGCVLGLRCPERLMGDWDRVRLEQVVTNLLSNACKYGEHRPIEVSLSEHDAVAELRVKDAGVGMTSEDQRRLFQPFVRVGDPSAQQGTGVGLWLTGRLVEAHGGTIRVESQPGEGSTFLVRLPLRRGDGSSQRLRPVPTFVRQQSPRNSV